MFRRSQNKSNGLSKSKRAQNAQVSTFQQLGLLGVESTASAWGRDVDRPTYTSSGKSFTNVSSFPEKSESGSV